MFEKMLIANGFITIPERDASENVTFSNLPLATVVGNMAYYGYTPNADALRALSKLDREELGTWWSTVRDILSLLSGDSRKIDKHVVYKNFPSEVLNFEGAEWIIRQIIIYITYDTDLVTQEERDRPALNEKVQLKVLAPADPSDIDQIVADLVVQRSRWTDNQQEWADTYFDMFNKPDDQFDVAYTFEIAAFGFRENAISVANKFPNIDFKFDAATDVLRLAAAMSEQDTSLRSKIAFKKFSRPERRKLLNILDGVDGITDDMALRPELWKRFMQRVRPGDYKFQNVIAAYDSLYNGNVHSFNAIADPQELTAAAIKTVAEQRPGVFLRNFHSYYGKMPYETVMCFLGVVIDKLTVRQLVFFKKYIAGINDRKELFVSPRGIMRKARIIANEKAQISQNHVDDLLHSITKVLGGKLNQVFPEGVLLDASADNIKLPSNDQKLAEYGRGTVFDIPEHVNFIRSASFWKHKSSSVVWYDNGWNFFSDDWADLGACCWDRQMFHGKAAAMSGDPVNVANNDKSGSQIIDLYLDKLSAQNVRYAVWSILCYSNQKFSEAEDMVGALQWGADENAGKLFEPSRAQMVFPLKGDELTNFLAVVDIKGRKLIYLDAPMRGIVSTAGNNGVILAAQMPAMMEKIAATPSLYDVLDGCKIGTVPVAFSDTAFDASVQKSYALVRNNADVGGERVALSAFIDL